MRKDEHFWFADGNVVLVLNQAVAFRAHASILAQRSQVFRDLFEVPQPTDQTKIDGCIVVHLSDDPVDMGVFLGFFYHAWEYV